jgi:nucleoside-diphosphate-sugar epimerase
VELGIGSLPESDLRELSEHIYSLKEFYSGRKIIVYGGTGFIGTWLCAGLIKAKFEFKLDLDLTIVTRSQKSAVEKLGLGAKSITFVQHDFSTGPLNSHNIADIVIHAATPTNPLTGSMNHLATVEGTINAADHAKNVRSLNSDKPYVLHLSSGSIYGLQPLSLRNRLETDKPLLVGDNAYTQAKIDAERILFDANQKGRVTLQSPRLFAFTGPLISLSHHYAVGNFLRNGINGEKIKVQGSPSTMRSYIYPLDLVKILFSLIKLNQYHNINIGNDLPISMIELATKISNLTSKRGVELINPEALPSNYVPSIQNLMQLVWQQDFISLDQAIEKWITWLESTGRGAKEA